MVNRVRKGALRQDEPGPFSPEHGERAHELHAQADAGIWNLDLLPRARSYLMRHDRISVCQAVTNQVVVGSLKKGIHGRRFIARSGGPGAQLGESGEDGGSSPG